MKYITCPSRKSPGDGADTAKHPVPLPKTGARGGSSCWKNASSTASPRSSPTTCAASTTWVSGSGGRGAVPACSTPAAQTRTSPALLSRSVGLEGARGAGKNGSPKAPPHTISSAPTSGSGCSSNPNGETGAQDPARCSWLSRMPFHIWWTETPSEQNECPSKTREGSCLTRFMEHGCF